jgi:hypothetical protein
MYTLFPYRRNNNKPQENVDDYSTDRMVHVAGWKGWSAFLSLGAKEMCLGWRSNMQHWLTLPSYFKIIIESATVLKVQISAL